MNDPNDHLEAELAALRPHDATPELRRRIADHRARAVSRGVRWRWGLALASGLAAACLVAILLRWEGGRNVEPAPSFVRTKPEPAPSVAVDDAGSTFLVYRGATACAHPKTWMPCSPRMLGSPKTLTQNSCKSLLSPDQVRHSTL